MATFEVKVLPIFIKDHPNAERLDIGNVGDPNGHQVVVAKGRLVTGDLVAYVPENAVVPEWVLKKYGYWDEVKGKGMLAGSAGDRVKAVKLREAFSLGIVIKVEKLNEHVSVLYLDGDKFTYAKEGDDVAEALGITKYEPVIPACMAGEVYNAGTEITLNYDVENFKNFPTAFEDGEEVVMTEKIHGTNCVVSYIPVDSPFASPNHLEVVAMVDGKRVVGQFAVASKGLGAQGLCFKWNQENSNNLYQKTVRKYFVRILEEIFIQGVQDKVHMIYGEVYGPGVQTGFGYGLKNGISDFRVFDIYVGIRGQGRFLSYQMLKTWVDFFDLDLVPTLYEGPFDFEKINSLIQNQKSTFDPNLIIEGGVIKSRVERYVPDLGRLSLKLLNEKYLLLKNKTEFQ